MSKLKKGYFVRGRFVAEGSAEDLELKQELKGSSEASRTDLKRESAELQKLGVDMLELRGDYLERLEIPDKLRDAITEAHRITNFEGRRRHLQFIGKLMRQLDVNTIDAIRAALTAQHAPTAHETVTLHQAEAWRDRLIASDDALGQWMDLCPDTDSQQLRALVRQARKDAKPEKPGEAQRHGRAYRDIFQIVRQALLAPNEPDPADDSASDSDTP